MKIKVDKGTPLHAARSLCETCSHSTIVKGEKLDEEVVVCHQIGMNGQRITFKVTECNSWEQKHRVRVSEMAKIAWIINTDTKVGPIGFMSPAKRKEKGIKVGDLETPDGTKHYDPAGED